MDEEENPVTLEELGNDAMLTEDEDEDVDADNEEDFADDEKEGNGND